MSLVGFGENIWTLDGDLVKMFTIPFGTRMTIVRLADGSLWIHSPVAFSNNRKMEVEELGKVKHLVAPNKFHHLALRDWSNEYPEAHIWAAPGLVKKRADLDFSGTLQNYPEKSWENEVDQCYFQGSKIFDEVVFFHKPSRVLILTDIIQNHDPNHDNWFWKMVKKWNGVLAPRGGVPRDLKLTFRDKKRTKESLEKVLSLDFKKIIISHGICIEEDAQNWLKNAFSWLK